MPLKKSKAHKHLSFDNPCYLETEGYAYETINDKTSIIDKTVDETSNDTTNEVHGAEVITTKVSDNKTRLASIYDKEDYLKFLINYLKSIMPTQKQLKKFKRQNKRKNKYALFGGKNTETDRIDRPIFEHYFIHNNSLKLKGTLFYIVSMPNDTINVENRTVSYEYIYNYLLTTPNPYPTVGQPLPFIINGIEHLVYSLEDL
jgi:hypothetical protein